MMRFRCQLAFGVLPLLLLVVGCGGSNRPATAPVQGVLQWEDGQPISGVSVRFVPSDDKGGREAVGYTGKDGAFTLSTFSQGDGAIPGDYTVVVTKPSTGGSSTDMPT